MADYFLNSGNGALFLTSHAYALNDVVFATSAATAARKQRTYVCDHVEYRGLYLPQPGHAC